MSMNKILLATNVRKSMISDDGAYFNLKGVPITVDGTVMNGIHYPAEENAKGMNSMVGKPFTIRHPRDELGNFISAREGKGLQDHYSGGVVTKTYNANGIWFADIIIKKGVLNAQSSELYEKLNRREDLPVSTGLLFTQNELSGVNSKGQKYDKTAVNQQYDHLAALMNERPAGGDSTVAVFNEEQVAVVNVEELMDKASFEIELADKSLIARVMEAFISFLHKGDKSGYNAGDNVNVNKEGNAEMLTKDELVQALAANAEQAQKDMQAAVNAAVEPLQAQVKALQDKLAANENAEKAELVGKVVALDIGINEETANAMTAAALNSVLAKNGQVNTGFGGAQRGANSAEPAGLEFGNPFKA